MWPHSERSSRRPGGARTLEQQENTQTFTQKFRIFQRSRTGHYQISNIRLPLPILAPLTWMKPNHDLWDITAEIQTTKPTQLGPGRAHWRVSTGLHEHKYPFYDPYPGYDHIRDMLFTFTQKILVVHIPVHLINTSFLVSVYWIVFVLAPVVFIVCNTNRGSTEKWEKWTTVACCWFGTINYQHCFRDES